MTTTTSQRHRYHFSIFYRGCKQPKSVHISIWNLNISDFDCKGSEIWAHCKINHFFLSQTRIQPAPNKDSTTAIPTFHLSVPLGSTQPHPRGALRWTRGVRSSMGKPLPTLGILPPRLGIDTFPPRPESTIFASETKKQMCSTLNNRSL